MEVKLAGESIFVKFWQATSKHMLRHPQSIDIRVFDWGMGMRDEKYPPPPLNKSPLLIKYGMPKPWDPSDPIWKTNA
jgi:hypothetical protein